MFHFVFFQLEELELLFFQELKYQNNTTPFYGIKEEYNAGAKAIYISIRNELAFSRKNFKQIICRKSLVVRAAKNKMH